MQHDINTHTYHAAGRLVQAFNNEIFPKQLESCTKREDLHMPLR
jgi:hypothetical protein